MNPANSLIIFTVFSGFGFGAMIWLGLGFYPHNTLTLMLIAGLAFLSTIAGLVASTFHLGNPQRALRAFSQWRSSWLSREAVLAIITVTLSFIYLSCIIVYDKDYQWLGISSAISSFFTIFSTAMIYGQMKTVPRWNTKFTPILFLLYGLTGSSIILMNFILLAVFFFTLGVLQIFTWLSGDKLFAADSHIGTATQLSNKKNAVRMLEPPHTGSNYLLKEMVHIVGQKHIFKLRWISLICAAIIPCSISLICFLLNIENISILFCIGLCHILGTLVSRWLFFSEAEHVVGLYYDRR